MSRITWTKGPYASYRGTVSGSIELFSIHYRTQRSEPTYSLHCQLPGLLGQRAKDDSADALKDKAEQLLDAWLTQIGAFE